MIEIFLKYYYINHFRSFPGVYRKVEKPLLVTTDIALVDPTDGKPTDVSNFFG